MNKVSIIIAVFNADKYLLKTLESVIYQKYTNWECIIIDDGSTDSSDEISNLFCKNDSRFKYYYQQNKGPSASRNFGFKQSKGDFIQYLDADDILMPERIELLVKKAAVVDEGVILYSDLLLGNHLNINNTSRLSKPASIGRDIFFDDMYKRFALDFIIIPSCVFFPRKAVENISWDENLSYSEDWDYYLKILKNNFIFRYISTPLIIYRNTPDSLSKDINNTIKANYKILGKWYNKRNGFSFSSRAAQFYQKSIVLYILNKNKELIKPQFAGKVKSLWFCFFYLLIFPTTVYYLIAAFFKAIFKKF
jgi:glycosyltransferase involved in cell wall biosynthesis